MNILGLQSQIVTPAYQAMVRATWPSTLKVIVPGGMDVDLLREWRQHRPDGLLILRQYFPDEHLAQAKFGPTFATAEMLRGLRPIVECPINEASQTSAGEIDNLNAYTLAFVRECVARGFPPAVGVFSEGNPADLSWWQHFFPALRAARAARGYLALHEYGVPSLGQEDWHLLRHRRVWAELPDDCRLPILVTECGIDGGIEGRREVGWRGYFSSTEYAAWLTAYHTRLLLDPYVHGATLFLCGGVDQWRSFDIADETDLRSPLTVSLAGAPRWTLWSDPPVTQTTPGIDISNNNGFVTLSQVRAAGYEFVAIKASGDEGSSGVFLDQFFPDNWRNAAAAGMARIAYHYACPSRTSPAGSVVTLQRALDAVGGLKTGDNVALDIEEEATPSGRSLHVWVAEWLDLAERLFGVRPYKYSARYYTSTRDLEHPDLERYPTWWASYQASMPAAVAGWRPIRIWQHSADALVPGVPGVCDTNLFQGTIHDLRALGKPAPAVPPEVFAALDTLWNYAGPDEEIQRAIVAVKVALGLQPSSSG